MSAATGVLDEAYERLHRTGPEFGAALSNHGPMAAEALVRMGRAARVHPWVDAYLNRLDALPRGIRPVGAGEWREALGDFSRTGDWLVHLDREVSGAPWREVLATWWPRLLPGIAAGATHGVIRTGHAVRALLEEETEPRVAELGQALGYWAARWTAVPLPGRLTGSLDPAAALARVPPVRRQEGGISERLSQLPETAGWSAAVGALSPVADAAAVPAALHAVADAAVARYVRRGHGNGVMMVHAVTAPSAVALVLPALPRDQWQPTLLAAWCASAAVDAAYAAPADAPSDAQVPHDPDEAVELAVGHGDEHVIKLTESALRSYARGAGECALAAAGTAARLIER